MMKKLSKAATLFVLVLTFTSINILTNEKKIKILIDPQEAVYGTPFSLKVTGLNPGEKVQLTTSSVDKNGTRWESNAKFRADKSGSIDLDNQAPEYGDYTGKNVLGPFWSMKPVKTKRKELPYFCDREKGLYVKFMITNAKGENTEAQLFRYYENPKKKLNCIKLNENGLKGFLFSHYCYW